MDLEKGERIPLFPISQNSPDPTDDGPPAPPNLPPLMVSVGEEDFLVTTGSTLEDPALGMFVDLNGDPVRGTLMFSSYPRAMSTPTPTAVVLMAAIDFPHLFALMHNFDIEVHSVETQQIVQTIRSPTLSANPTITRIPAGANFCLPAMAEKLLMVPFDSEVVTPPARRDEEIQIARRLSMVSSRVALASGKTLSTIITSPWFLQADTLLDANRVEEALALAEQASQTIDDMQFDAERLVPEPPSDTSNTIIVS